MVKVAPSSPMSVSTLKPYLAFEQSRTIPMPELNGGDICCFETRKIFYDEIKNTKTSVYLVSLIVFLKSLVIGALNPPFLSKESMVWI